KVRLIYEISIDSLTDLLLDSFASDLRVVPQAGFSGMVFGETDDHAVHSCFSCSFGVPGEGAVGKFDFPPSVEDGAEQSRYRLALGDRVSCHEGELARTLAIKVDRLFVPPGHIVEVTVVILAPDVFHVSGLLVGLGVLADERGVTEK